MFRKVFIVVQFPLRLVLFLSSPVLRVGDYTDKTGWDKILVALQVSLVLATQTIIKFVKCILAVIDWLSLIHI